MGGTEVVAPKIVAECGMLDAVQVMTMLKISKTTLYGLMRRGKDPIPSVRIGKSRRFPVDKLRWWMEKLEK